LGSFTSKIGDPTGKSVDRKILTPQEIEENKARIKKVISSVLKKPVIFVDNNDWLSQLSYVDFLDSYARNLSVNRMIKLDSVAPKLSSSSHLSLMELNYMVLQAIDFVHLYKKYNCTVQLGGSDQWGNIIMGVELGKKLLDANLTALTIPLFTSYDGKKMGKSEGNCVWLCSEMTRPYDMWQYFRNLDDRLVEKSLLCFSDLSPEEISSLLLDINKAKIKLADIVTIYVHGSEVLPDIHQEVKINFQKTPINESHNESKTLKQKVHNIETMKLEDLLIMLGISETKNDARRKIMGHGVQVDGITVYSLDIKTFQQKKTLKISYGKKVHKIIELV
jgi:tyrosyl-tRNA synthetase